MKLINAMRTKDTTTTNGMAAHSTTLNACVDLFSSIGSLRGRDKQMKINLLVKAMNEDALTTMKILFWTRDVRGGAGERETFKQLMVYLANNHTDLIRKNLFLIPEYGRWDDVLPLLDTKLADDTLALIRTGLEDKNGLCAKWIPSPNVKNSDKKRWAKAIMRFLNLSPKEYRKLRTELATTVEQAMCSGDWSKINYAHVPSKAMSDYMKAFGRHDGERFTQYLDSVSKGETKINAGAVYPYDITKNLKHGDADGASVQWDSLPNYMEGNNERVMPLVDVSGSMMCSAGGSASVTCMDVAISLGLYISERNEGPFKDAFLTFTSTPKLEVLSGNLKERYGQLSRADWGGSTNIEAAYRTMLNSAVTNKVPSNEMPTMILILSDMQFDSATGGGWGSPSTWNPTAHEMVRKMYAEAGYEMPKIVYWNLNASNSNHPVQSHETGAALVSGFSPALLKALLGGKDMTPLSMMMDVIGTERYAPITV